MATPQQTNYIADLTVKKTKEFKEVKELLVANNIVGGDSQTIAGAGTIAEICNALTDQQASAFIDVLIAAKEPARANKYGDTRIKRTIAGLEKIKSTVAGWDF